jgi:phage-related minor tail protein
MSMDDKEEMQDALDDAAEAGRGEDSMLAHVARGEIVLPLPLANDPEIKALLAKKFKAADINMNQYVVGHKDNSINPETGLPEFKWLKKLAGTIIGGTLGFFIGGPAGAIQGAKIGAGVDTARMVVDNAEQAREQSRQAQQAALEEAQKAREQALTESQKARELTLQQLADARAANTTALDQQRTDAAGRLEMARLSAQQQADLLQNLSAQQAAAAEAARATLASQQAQFAEQKSMMEKQAKDQAAALDAERRKIAERESAQMTARRRSGRRALLSEARLTPETGVVGQYGNEAVLTGA